MGEVCSVMARMIALWKSKGHKKTDQTEWWSRIEGWRARRSLDFRQSGEEILPQRALAALYEATKGRNPIITTEVGQHQMWAAQHRSESVVCGKGVAVRADLGGRRLFKNINRDVYSQQSAVQKERKY